MELPRYDCERCMDCGRGLNWIEIAFGQFGKPICGRCLLVRQKAFDAQQERQEKSIADGNVAGMLGED